jgi:hypothetical protein
MQRRVGTMGTFSLSCKFKSVSDQIDWAFSRLYGPNADSQRTFYGKTYLGFRMFPSASGVTLMLPTSKMKGLGLG